MLAFRICSDFSRIGPRSVIIRQKFSLSFFKRNEYVLFTLQSYHVLHTIRYAARIFQECAAPYFCRAGRAIISNRTNGKNAARLAVVVCGGGLFCFISFCCFVLLHYCVDSVLKSAAKIILRKKPTIFYAIYFLLKSKIIVLFICCLCKLQYINKLQR